MLQRLGEVVIARLQLLEQADVLDGYGRLVSKGLHQGDLTIRERPNLVPLDADRSQQLSRPEHRDCKQGPERELPIPVGVLGVGPDIVNVDGASLKGGAPRAAMASGRDGILLEELSLRGGEVVGDHGLKKLTVEAEDRYLFSLAQPHRVLGQRFEDRL